MLQRWSKLERDFRMKNGRYDISKIPDIYDCVKYDTQHNSSLGLDDMLELFRLSRALADIIIPQVEESIYVSNSVHLFSFILVLAAYMLSFRSMESLKRRSWISPLPTACLWSRRFSWIFREHMRTRPSTSCIHCESLYWGTVLTLWQSEG